MPKATGRCQVSGAKKGAAWGTAVVLGAGDGIRILPDSIVKSRVNNPDDSLGEAYSKSADPDVIAVSGALPGYLRYDGLDLLIALVMGATGGAPAQQGGTTAYLQSFTWGNCLDGLFATVAMNLNTMVKEFPSLKFMGMKISGEVGKPLMVEFNVIGDDLVEDSAINTFATMANITFAPVDRVLFQHGVFRMNLTSGAALASPGDVIKPSKFELDIQRPQQGVYATETDVDIVDEPTGSEVPKVTLTLTFPRLTGNTEFTRWDAGAPYKMDMTFTGANIDGAFDYTMTFEMPSLVYSDVNAPADQGAVPNDVVFDVIGIDVAPTGMAVNAPVEITVINTETADVLA